MFNITHSYKRWVQGISVAVEYILFEKYQHGQNLALLALKVVSQSLKFVWNLELEITLIFNINIL